MKEPSESRVNEPLAGPVTCTAVRGAPPPVSLSRTPGAATFKVVPSTTV